MRSLFYSFFGYFLTPAGLVVMAALDSSLIFFLPLGLDFVVIILAARRPELFWLYAILAAAGSLAGSAVTFWVGRQIGEHGISKLVKPSRLARIEERVNARAAYSLAVLALIPPPFPFTAFVLHQRGPSRSRVDVLHHAGGRAASALRDRRRARRALWPRDCRLDGVGRSFNGSSEGSSSLRCWRTVISAIAIVRSTRRRGKPRRLRHAQGSRSHS